MAEEDSFDIDLYGDLDTDHAAPKKDEEPELILYDGAGQNGTHKDEHPDTSMKVDVVQDDSTLRGSTDGTPSRQDTPNSAMQTQQSLKRKEPSDEGATPNSSSATPRLPGTEALQISDLNWWTTDDDVRGWINQAGAEGELKELTFNEHKVNGKSKGAVFVAFSSVAAASAVKDKIEQFNSEVAPGSRKILAHFANPHLNMFKTLPKDVPGKNTSGGFQRNTGGGGGMNNYNNNNQSGGGYNSGNFRGRGGFNRGGNQGFQNRGGFNQGGYNNYNNNNNNNQMGGNFQGNHMNQGFNMRGNMMGGNMRGGRGGNMMGMNPMNQMGNMMGMGGGQMGGMGRGGFGQMPGNFPNQMMNQNFQGGGAGHFNPAFFGGGGQQHHGQQQGGGQGGQQQGGGDWNNPHGAKRPRAE